LDHHPSIELPIDSRGRTFISTDGFNVIGVIGGQEDTITNNREPNELAPLSLYVDEPLDYSIQLRLQTDNIIANQITASIAADVTENNFIADSTQRRVASQRALMRTREIYENESEAARLEPVNPLKRAEGQAGGWNLEKGYSV
jgi:hypothetical protein